MRALMSSLTMFFVAAGLTAQATGRLSGTIVGTDRTPVPSCTVTLITSGATVPELATMTTSDGLFSFTSIRPDSYDLTVSAPGFQPYSCVASGSTRRARRLCRR
jgi:Carboxypeptidase regulatory-like domain